VAFSPDGRLAYSGGSADTRREGPDSVIRIWNVEQAEAVPTSDDFTGRVFALSPDGERILTGGSSPIALRDARSGREIRRLPGHNGHVTDIAMLADGRRAVSTGTDKTIRLWDLDAGTEVGMCSVGARYAEVFALAVSPNGRRLLSSHQNGALLRLWDIDTLKVIQTVRWPGNGWPHAPTRGGFSQDGTSVVWGGADGITR